jgi:hypothetical protein
MIIIKLFKEIFFRYIYFYLLKILFIHLKKIYKDFVNIYMKNQMNIYLRVYCTSLIDLKVKSLKHIISVYQNIIN